MKYITSVVLDRATADGRILRFRVKWDGSRSIVSMNVGYSVNPDGWSARTFRCLPRTNHGRRRVPASEINGAIVALEEAAARAAARFDGSPSVEAFRAAFREEMGMKKPAPERGILDELRTFVSAESSRSGWTIGTENAFLGLKKHLSAFLAGHPVSSLGDFGEREYVQFCEYLKSSGLRNSTVAGISKRLRWFLRWGGREGLMASTDFSAATPRIKQATKEVVFLDRDEVFRLMRAELPEHLGNVRDAFLFQCFTGLRFSDVRSLRCTDISDTAVTVTTQKTAERLSIELNRYSRAILEKHREFAKSTGRPFPMCCNQVMNREIKEACRLAGIDTLVHLTYYRGSERFDETLPKWQLISTHAGRRTFVCLMLGLGVPVTTVMKWTGHSDYKAMKPYIAVSDRMKADAMRLVDSL